MLTTDCNTFHAEKHSYSRQFYLNKPLELATVLYTNVLVTQTHTMVDVQEQDQWISHLSECKQLTEADIKRLCDKVHRHNGRRR